MTKHIIILNQPKSEMFYKPPYSIMDVDQLAASNDDGELLFFDTKKEAEKHMMDADLYGKVVSLPMDE